MARQELESRQREALGFRLHVREGGTGAPVALIHGLGVSGRYFEPLARQLARTHRVLVPDLPGWGISEAPRRALTLDAAADVLGAMLSAEEHTPALVANSLGCQIVLRLAERRPALVGRIVLIGPTIDPRYRSWTRHAARLLLDTTREPVSLWPLVLVDYARMGLRRVLATARAALADRPESRLPLVDHPLLVVRGERDAMTTLEWARRCARLAPHGTFMEIPMAAHAAHFSHPTSVARLVESFLTEGRDRVS